MFRHIRPEGHGLVELFARRPRVAGLHVPGEGVEKPRLQRRDRVAQRRQPGLRVQVERGQGLRVYAVRQRRGHLLIGLRLTQPLQAVPGQVAEERRQDVWVLGLGRRAHNATQGAHDGLELGVQGDEVQELAAHVVCEAVELLKVGVDATAHRPGEARVRELAALEHQRRVAPGRAAR